MPDSGRILHFPVDRTPESLSADEALSQAQAYLALREMDPAEGLPLPECDILFAVCRVLRDKFESTPSATAVEATALYEAINGAPQAVGVFDEREYLLGETSLIAAKSSRLLGKFEEASRWLDRSEAVFRHTINPAPPLTAIAFERLALRYATGHYNEILDMLPSVKSSFSSLGMYLDHAKADFLEAVTFRAIGKPELYFAVLCSLEKSKQVQQAPSLHGQVLVHLGSYHASLGDFQLAAQIYEKALPIVLQGNRPVALCELKWAIADAYRDQGLLGRALGCYRSAKVDYANLGLRAFTTQLSLVMAEVLLALGREREAEWEILSALPIIEKEGLVPEGLAAVALIKESVSARSVDRKALHELREHLHARAE